MTNEEAIKWLNVERQLIVEVPQDNSKELKEAYDMAIQALEKNIEKEPVQTHTRYGMGNEYQEAKAMAIKALEQTNWIPVSERLPRDSGYYLTTTMYDKVYCDYWEGECFNRTEAVIAWMPLPEPYKAESEV